jgi:very-short-patch-repair endonuclease
MPFDRECAQCGVAFASRKRDARFCTIACVVASRTVFNRLPRACPTCGKTFVPPKQNRGQVYCSMSCRSKVCRVDRQPKPCRRCGKDTSNITYCGRECYNAVRQRPNWTCHNCGKEFYRKLTGVQWYKNKDGKQTNFYCGSQCHADFRRRRAERRCEVCGVGFAIKVSHVGGPRNGGRYCSTECTHKGKVSQIEIVCVQCGKSFNVRKGRADTVRYCSRRCKSHFKGESTPERLIREALDRLGVTYKQEFKIGRRYSLDFLLPDLGVALEADGDYWHANRGDHDRKRDAWIMKHKGIRTVRIKASEIRQCGDLDKLIRRRLASPRCRPAFSLTPPLPGFESVVST